MRLAALVSGGKDGTLALHHAIWDGHEVAYLVTMVPERSDSWMFHVPNLHLMPLIAQALGIPLVQAPTSGVKERELEDLKATLAKLDVDGVVSGAVASRYQKERIDRICEELGLASVAPLWGRDELSVLEEVVELGFHVIFVGIFAYGLDASWLGRCLDEQAIEDLVALRERYGISLVGEGGEYETLVLDAPLFKARLEVVKARRAWDPDKLTGVLEVLEARLVPKGTKPFKAPEGALPSKRWSGGMEPPQGGGPGWPITRLSGPRGTACSSSPMGQLAPCPPRASGACSPSP